MLVRCWCSWGGPRGGARWEGFERLGLSGEELRKSLSRSGLSLQVLGALYLRRHTSTFVAKRSWSGAIYNSCCQKITCRIMTWQALSVTDVFAILEVSIWQPCGMCCPFHQ